MIWLFISVQYGEVKRKFNLCKALTMSMTFSSRISRRTFFNLRLLYVQWFSRNVTMYSRWKISADALSNMLLNLFDLKLENLDLTFPASPSKKQPLRSASILVIPTRIKAFGSSSNESQNYRFIWKCKSGKSSWLLISTKFLPIFSTLLLHLLDCRLYNRSKAQKKVCVAIQKICVSIFSNYVNLTLKSFY